MLSQPTKPYDWSAPPPPKGGDSNVRKLRSFKVQDGTTRRLLIVGDEPFFVGFVHGFYAYSNHYGLKLPGNEFNVCFSKNETEFKGQPCPLCEAKTKDKNGKTISLSWASRKMFFTGIDMGIVDPSADVRDAFAKVKGDEWQGKVYQFQPCIVMVSIGSEDKPGMDLVVKDIRKKMKSNLNGALISCSRNGKLDHGVGGKWETIGRIDEDGNVLGGIGVNRLALPSDEAGRLAVLKAYIQGHPEIFGVIPDDDNRIKYLSMKMPTIDDLPCYSPEEVTRRYGATVPKKPDGVDLNQGSDDDSDIPF